MSPAGRPKLFPALRARGLELWAEGWSLELVAQTLGPPVTRGMVAGWMRRAGAQRGHRAHTQGKALIGGQKAGERKPRESRARRESKALPLPLLPALRTPLLELGPRACHWPVGGRGQSLLCCGQPQAERRGSQPLKAPYCPGHLELAYVKDSAERKQGPGARFLLAPWSQGKR